MIKKEKFKLSFIDLFAGCGGLSLGLENAGFHPIYVNELNRDAMESYLINRDDKYPLLREKYSCYDIKSLTRGNKTLNELESGLKCDYGIEKGELDLVVGGPPCQGYSGIGHRRSYSVNKSDIPSNYLYKDMLKVIKKMNPLNASAVNIDAEEGDLVIFPSKSVYSSPDSVMFQTGRDTFRFFLASSINLPVRVSTTR